MFASYMLHVSFMALQYRQVFIADTGVFTGKYSSIMQEVLQYFTYGTAVPAVWYSGICLMRLSICALSLLYPCLILKMVVTLRGWLLNMLLHSVISYRKGC